MPVYEEEGEKMPYSKLVKNFNRIREYNAAFYFDKNEGITQTLDAEAPSSKSSETNSASLPSDYIIPQASEISISAKRF